MYSDYPHQNLGGNKTIPFYFSVLQTIYRTRQGCESLLLRFSALPLSAECGFSNPGVKAAY